LQWASKNSQNLHILFNRHELYTLGQDLCKTDVVLYSTETLVMFPYPGVSITFANYDIIAYFLNLASCSEHFISIKYRILATFNINKKINSDSCSYGILPIVPKSKSYPDEITMFLKAYKLSELIFLFILKVANIRYFILIKCNEQEVRFKKKYAIVS
jgi:hypothetical protein